MEIYWSLPKGSTINHEAKLPIAGDIYIADVFRNVLVLYSDDEKEIVVTCIEEPSLIAFLEETDGEHLNDEIAEGLRIGEYFIGWDFEDIFVKFEDLIGVIEVSNEDGSITTIPKVNNYHFEDCENR